MTASVDLPWMWQSTADLRAVPYVGTGVLAMEQTLGSLSLENEVLPWVGDAAFMLSDVRPEGPAWALMLQMRDADRVLGSDRLEEALQTTFVGRTPPVWIAMEYKGVPIRRIEINQGYSILKIATAKLDGWLIITFGDGVIRKIIDTHDGDSPALTAHPAFAKAIAEAPKNTLGQCCVNGQGILAQVIRDNPYNERALKGSELGNGFLFGAMTCPGDTAEFDLAYVTSSPTTRATLKQLRADAGTVTGTSLVQQPEGTFATLLLRNPSKWVSAVEEILLDSASDSYQREEILRVVVVLYGPLSALKRCHGELGVSAAWNDGGGLGITFAGETDSPDDATMAADYIRSFMDKEDRYYDYNPVQKIGNLYTLPETLDGNRVFPNLLCWTTRKQWLLASSHPGWVMQPSTAPTSTLPIFVTDANLAAVGDFAFLPSFLKAIHVNQQIVDILPFDKLGSWGFAMKIAADGSAVRCHLSVGKHVVATSVAMLFPAFTSGLEKAQKTKSVSNLKQVVLSVHIYIQENDERLPMIKTSADMTKYLDIEKRMLHSPRTHELYAVNPSIAGKPLGSFAYPEDTIIFYEKTPWPDGGRYAAYLDGHVDYISANRWQAAKRRSHIP